MRVVAVGCEYSGVSTLIDRIDAWGKERGIQHHLDDHFTIPDAFHLDETEQRAMLSMLPAIKERFQRFQIVYHIRLINRYEHILLGGFHIEERVYGPHYYYPGIGVEIREYEPDMPEDTILVHLYARPEVIHQRMQGNPHPHPLLLASDVKEVLEQFQREVAHSWIHRKIAIDTSDLTPEQLLEIFLQRSIPHLNARDALTRVQLAQT
ncbi:MAG: hypothetical protein VX733_12180 [Candidatus Latescibacterota bacterium]|nr:hypothetical protein [Candidatus Latescibacterota bacterium]